MGLFDGIVRNVGELVGINSLGQATMDNSLPVVLPSDQDIPLAQSYKDLWLTAADPTMSSASDLTGASGSALASVHFQVRVATELHIEIPMAAAGYRSCVITIHNSTTAWTYASGNSIPTVRLYGGIKRDTTTGKTNGTTRRSGKMLEFTWRYQSGSRCMIGPGAVSDVGGTPGVSPGADLYWYRCDAMASGVPYLIMSFQFDNAPTAGEWYIGVTRLGF